MTDKPDEKSKSTPDQNSTDNPEIQATPEPAQSEFQEKQEAVAVQKVNKEKLKEKQDLIKNKLTFQIKSLSIGKEDLHKLLHILQERSNTACDIELADYEQLELTDQEYEANKEILKEGFELKITLLSPDGQEFYGTIDDVFNSPNFPDQIKSVFVGSEIPLKVGYNYYPRNSFQLFLDFSKPELFNMSFLPSLATPNESNIAVQGYDATWTHGVYHEFNTFIKKYPSRFTWIHKHSIYDFLLYIIGLPYGFWFCYKLSSLLTNIFGKFSSFVQSAAYVYVFLVALVLFRLLFHYSRWIWPLVEYSSPKNLAFKHRVTLTIITLGMASTLICDLIKAVF